MFIPSIVDDQSVNDFTFFVNMQVLAMLEALMVVVGIRAAFSFVVYSMSQLPVNRAAKIA
jgi:hypothetical protein